MQINQRKAGVLLNYGNEAIRILTALLYTPLMLRLLGQSEYGLYQLVSSTVAYLSLLSLGFGSAYVRYHARYYVKNDVAGIARLNGMFLIIFCTMSALCLVCGGVMIANAHLLFGDGLTDAELAKAKVLMVILIISMAISFPNSVFSSYVTAYEKFVFQKALIIIQSLLNPCLALPLLLLGYDSVAVVAVSASLTLLVFLLNGYFCLKQLRMRFSFKGLEYALLKEMWAFTFFIFLNQIIDQINWSVDKFLLGRMVGTTAVAVYGVGGQINSMYLQMSSSVSTVFVTRVNQIVAESDDNALLTKMMARVGRIQFLILALIVTGFIFFGQAFIALWAGEAYKDAYYVTLLLLIPVTVPLIQNLGLEIQRAKNKHRVRSIVFTILALLNVVLSVFLIQRWGCVGAAVGTAASLILGNGLFMNWYYHAKLDLNMVVFWKEIVRMLPGLLIACLFGLIYVFFVQIHSWLALLLSAVLYTVVYAALMWLLGMNDYEKNLVLKVLGKLPGVKKRNDQHR